MGNRHLGVCGLALAGVIGLVSPEKADARHHHHRRYGRHGHTSVYLGYGPGYYPSFGIGYGHYPFSIGFGYIGGPKDDRGSIRLQVHLNKNIARE